MDNKINITSMNNCKKHGRHDVICSHEPSKIGDSSHGITLIVTILDTFKLQNFIEAFHEVANLLRSLFFSLVKRKLQQSPTILLQH